MANTAADLVRHWEWAAEKGLMNANSAGALKTACVRVLEIEDGWESLPIDSMDVDALLKRFRTIKAKSYKPESLREYDRRFRKAYSSYIAYVRDPASWSGSDGEPSRRERKAVRRTDATPPPPATDGADARGLVDYPFPLREGRIVRMTLPVDLTVAEVKRLSAFLGTLAVDADSANG